MGEGRRRDSKRVVVVGGGVGGLACGALLAKKGFHVEVLERNSFPGGKCSAFEKEGFLCDRFSHGFAQGAKSPHMKISSILGSDLTFLQKDPPFIVVDEYTGRRKKVGLPLDINSFEAQAKLASELGVEAENLGDAARCLDIVLRGDEEVIKENDGRIASDFLLDYTDDEEFHRFMAMMALLMFAIPYYRCSAGEFIYTFSTMFRKAAYGYPLGGANAIPAAYVEGLERFGGRLRLGKAVSKIIVEHKAVKGVESDEGFIEADIVVSNAGLKKTVLDLVGEAFFSREYVNYVRSLKDSDGVVAIRYALDRKVIREPFFFYPPKESAHQMFRFLEKKDGLPGDLLLFVPVISNWDPNLTPPGKQLVICATICRNELDSNFREIANRMDRRFKEIWPEVEGHILWQHLTGPDEVHKVTGKGIGECIGLAQTPDQVGDRRPRAKLPIEGLYVVGADTEGRGVGTDMAADSALVVSELID